MNSQIQGSAADLVKQAMINIGCEVAKLYPENGGESVNWKNSHSEIQSVIPILNLHDELIFEVRKSHLNSVVQIIRKEMENALPLSVPFPVVVKCGPNWGQMERIE